MIWYNVSAAVSIAAVASLASHSEAFAVSSRRMIPVPPRPSFRIASAISSSSAVDCFHAKGGSACSSCGLRGTMLNSSRRTARGSLSVRADRKDTLRCGLSTCDGDGDESDSGYSWTGRRCRNSRGGFSHDAHRKSLRVRRQVKSRWVSAVGSEPGGGGEESNALLLRMEFTDVEVEDLRNWMRRYPFGTALPVQPFSLVETDLGLDVIFRKKPTAERRSQDGGLSFVVDDCTTQEGAEPSRGPMLTLRRISEGQQIRKMFAERIVVKAVVKSLAGEGTPAPPAGTKVVAVLHEGLV